MISAWELAIKIGIGKLDFAGKAAGFVRLAEDNGFTVLPIKTSHLTTYESLPFIHRDPFDRLLVATAVAEQMSLITADENIARYDVSLVW
jgi:PIN domain nuclease of toxin-antitoxin system